MGLAARAPASQGRPKGSRNESKQGAVTAQRQRAPPWRPSRLTEVGRESRPIVLAELHGHGVHGGGAARQDKEAMHVPLWFPLQDKVSFFKFVGQVRGSLSLKPYGAGLFSLRKNKCSTLVRPAKSERKHEQGA
jgi:hypothetical protein